MEKLGQKPEQENLIPMEFDDFELKATQDRKKPKNLKGLLEEMTSAGATSFAILSDENANIDNLEFKPLS